MYRVTSLLSGSSWGYLGGVELHYYLSFVNVLTLEPGTWEINPVALSRIHLISLKGIGMIFFFLYQCVTYLDNFLSKNSSRVLTFCRKIIFILSSLKFLSPCQRSCGFLFLIKMNNHISFSFCNIKQLSTLLSTKLRFWAHPSHYYKLYIPG